MNTWMGGRSGRAVVLSVFVGAVLAASVRAAEFGDRLMLHGVLAGASQRENAVGIPGEVDKRRGSGPFQLELSFTPHTSSEFFAKVGFAAGNGLNDCTFFNLASWAADHEADVVNINGRGRNHLLTAWYKYTLAFNSARSLGISAGIVDAADYLDQNAYANDEYTQFMNEALVNGPNSFAPSYDYGGVVELAMGRLSATGVAMEVGQNDDGRSFRYIGAQLAYATGSGGTSGNYRVIAQGSDRSFVDVSGQHLESRAALLLSFDQRMGSTLGVWTRLGWQSDRAAVSYADLYSGGVDINGTAWRRAMDNIGLGYAYLTGGNVAIAGSDVFEVYLRLGLSEVLQITGDVQYMKDKLKANGSNSGFIFGLRLTALF